MYHIKLSILLALPLIVTGLLFLSDGCFPAIGLNCGLDEYSCVLQNYTSIRIGCYPCYNVAVECGSCMSTDAKFDTIDEVDNNFIIGSLKTFYTNKNKCFYELPSQDSTIFGFSLLMTAIVFLLIGCVKSYLVYRNPPAYTEFN